MASAL
ncbi:hypothetical protein ZOSMA_226G00090, partial [Zostera marina]|jgi:hypothetical protein